MYVYENPASDRPAGNPASTRRFRVRQIGPRAALKRDQRRLRRLRCLCALLVEFDDLGASSPPQYLASQA